MIGGGTVPFIAVVSLVTTVVTLVNYTSITILHIVANEGISITPRFSGVFHINKSIHN